MRRKGGKSGATSGRERQTYQRRLLGDGAEVLGREDPVDTVLKLDRDFEGDVLPVARRAALCLGLVLLRAP